MNVIDRFTGTSLGEFDISPNANLSFANLSGADLRGADLREANLIGADLSGADLRGANLSGADLRWADLSRADLRFANLTDAILFYANLSFANLRFANLSGADLHGADLRGADLHGAKYNPLNIIQANWRGDISSQLCAVMMAFDRDAHPHPEQFKLWAQDGKCPLESASVDRALLFDEKRELYNHSLVAPTVWKLWTMIAAEFNIKI